MYSVRAFAVVALAPAGLIGLAAIFGGGWIWAAFIYMTLGVWSLDRIAGTDNDTEDATDTGTDTDGGAAAGPAVAEAPGPAADRLSVALALSHFALLALTVGALARGGQGLAPWLALFWTAGMFFGQVSNSNAHELIHRSDRRLFALGKWVYISLLFGHHTSAHLKVHHRFAATRDDPNSARAGESFYAFAPRAWRGSFRKGYAAERADIIRRGTGGATPYVAYVLGGLGFLLAAGLGFGAAGVAVYLGLAAHAQAQLLLSDYVQHYGLVRRIGADGRPEPIGPAHSWNSARRFSALLMLNAPRHSDHHAHPGRRFPRLVLPPADAAPRLPASLPVMAMVALYPPRWRRMMDRPLDAWNGTEGEPA